MQQHIVIFTELPACGTETCGNIHLGGTPPTGETTQLPNWARPEARHRITAHTPAPTQKHEGKRRRPDTASTHYPLPYKMSRRKKIQKKYIPLNYYHYHHYYYYIIKRHSHIRESAKSRPTCQLPIFTCQRAKSVSIIELGVPTCEKNRGANFSTSLARRRTSFSTIFQFFNF